MMNRVTAKIDSGIRAATRRKKSVEITHPGAASQTMRMTGGIFRSALSRSLQLGLGISFIAGLVADIASLSSSSKLPEFESLGCAELSVGAAGLPIQC